MKQTESEDFVVKCISILWFNFVYILWLKCVYYIDINWNWQTADGGRWSNWGDAEIQNNAYVGQNYQIAINKCNCFNGGTKSQVLSKLGLSEQSKDYTSENVVRSFSNYRYDWIQRQN